MSIYERAMKRYTNSPARPSARQELASGEPEVSLQESCGTRKRGDAVSNSAACKKEVVDLSSIKEIVCYKKEVLGDRARLDEFRRIKRSLLKEMARGAPHNGVVKNVVGVTSAIAGEGKTYISTNLALSWSLEKDRTVLLIDADLQRRDVTRILGLNGHPGLTDLALQPGLDVADVLVRTSLDNLVVLPAGAPNSCSVELLSSPRIKAAIQEIAERYTDRLVIVDNTPIIGAGEFQTIAEMMGQIMLVVGAGKTPRHMVAEALAHLHNYKGSMGVVLNRFRPYFLSKFGNVSALSYKGPYDSRPPGEPEEASRSLNAEGGRDQSKTGSSREIGSLLNSSLRSERQK